MTDSAALSTNGAPRNRQPFDARRKFFLLALSGEPRPLPDLDPCYRCRVPAVGTEHQRFALIDVARVVAECILEVRQMSNDNGIGARPWNRCGLGAQEFCPIFKGRYLVALA